MNNKKKSPIRDWARSSLLAHVIASIVFFSTPIFVVFLYVHHVDGVLTVGLAMWTLLVTLLGGVCFGALFWFTVTSRTRQAYRDRFEKGSKPKGSDP